ncbi:MAG: VWA domain-containing protein, partial [Limisphaerales bacterium]
MKLLLTMGCPSRSGVNGKLRMRTKNIPQLAMLIALATVAPVLSISCNAEEEGVALAIIYDTSGSMKDPVPDKSGRSAPKYVVANRALIAVAHEIQAFATNTASGPARKVHTALFVFQGEHAREAIKMGPFDAAALENFAQHFSSPNGNTPLGNTLKAAARAVMASPLSRKHVLVITDGINTAGLPPATVLPALKKQAQEKGANLAVHFIAFDVDAKVFSPLKKMGATVVAAADENQLNTQLQYIL